MIDYSTLGAQTIPGNDPDEIRRRRQAVQSGQPSPTQPTQPTQPQSAPSPQPQAPQSQAQQLQQTFAQMQSQGVARPAPPPPAPSQLPQLTQQLAGASGQSGQSNGQAIRQLMDSLVTGTSTPVAQGYPASATPVQSEPRPRTDPAAVTTGATTMDPTQRQRLYNALASYQSTMPNYGRDPAQVMAALRSGDPELQRMAQEAITHFTPQSAFDNLSDAEFQQAFGMPKAATQYGAQLANKAELDSTGRSFIEAINGPAGLASNGASADMLARIAQYLQPGANARTPEWQAAIDAAGGTWTTDQNGNPRQNPGSVVAGSPAPGGASGSALGSQIQSALQGLLANPTAYGTDAMQREYEAGARQIDDQFTLQQKALNEEMARRGLYDSSIAAGNLSDLNIGKRSAQVELMDRLLGKRADSQDAGIRSALAAAMGYDTSQQSLGLDRDRLAATIDQFNRSLDFDKSRYTGDSDFREREFTANQSNAMNTFLAYLYQLFGGTEFAS